MRKLTDKYGSVDDASLDEAIGQITNDLETWDQIYKLVEEVRDIQRQVSYDEGYEAASELYYEGYAKGLAEAGDK